MVEMRPQEKPNCAAKVPALNSASSERPYVCPFAGCEKAYIHEYKLNLHLRKEHPGHNPEECYKLTSANVDQWFDDLNEQDSLLNNNRYSKRAKTSMSRKLPRAKFAKQRGSSPTPVVSNDAQKRRPSKELDEDSEETEDQEEEDDDGWRFLEANRDDEETEDED